MGMIPRRLIRPRVGRQLKSEFALAGLRRLFTVSDPVAKTENDAATAAPEPPDEPRNRTQISSQDPSPRTSFSPVPSHLPAYAYDHMGLPSDPRDSKPRFLPTQAHAD